MKKSKPHAKTAVVVVLRSKRSGLLVIGPFNDALKCLKWCDKNEKRFGKRGLTIMATFPPNEDTLGRLKFLLP